MTRVVITGMGAVTPIGNDVNEYSDNLFQGKLGIAPITKFDATETGVTNAGEVKDFDATLRVGKKAAKRMDLKIPLLKILALFLVQGSGT